MKEIERAREEGNEGKSPSLLKGEKKTRREMKERDKAHRFKGQISHMYKQQPYRYKDYKYR